MNEQLDLYGRVLIRCFLLTAALILIWFVFYLLVDDWAYAIHSRWFELDRARFDLMNYYGMALLKLLAYVLFLIPWVAIRLVLRQANRV